MELGPSIPRQTALNASKTNIRVNGLALRRDEP
jgi:hypothetical protein